MNKKPLQVPIEIEQLEALKARIHPNHPKHPQLDYELAKRWRGYRGEKSLQYYLNLMDTAEVIYFYQLRLKIKETFFQIDTLILTRYFIFILETKNYKGEEIYFDSNFDQISRKIDGKDETMDDPLLQAKKHKIQLLMWLRKNKITTFIPIEEFVVIANTKCLIKSAPNHTTARQKIIRPPGLLSKVEIYKNKYSQPVFTIKELRKIANLLLKQHTPVIPNTLGSYRIEPNEINRGVLCLNCSTVMTHVKGFWKCEQCNYLSKTSYIKALKDYVLLYGQKITNRQIRDFLRVDSRYVAKRILQKHTVIYSGKGSQTIYLLPFPEEIR